MRRIVIVLCFLFVILFGVNKSEAFINHDANHGETVWSVTDKECLAGGNAKWIASLIPHVVRLSGLTMEKNGLVRIYPEGKKRTRIVLPCNKIQKSTPKVEEPREIVAQQIPETETAPVQPTVQEVSLSEPLAEASAYASPEFNTTLVESEPPDLTYDPVIVRETSFLHVEPAPKKEIPEVTQVAEVIEPEVIKAGVYDISLKAGFVEPGPLPVSIVIRRESEEYWKRVDVRDARVELNQDGLLLRVPVKEDVEIEPDSLVIVDLGEPGKMPISPKDFLATSHFTQKAKLRPIKLDKIQWKSLNESFPQEYKMSRWKKTFNFARFVVAPAVGGYFSMGSAPLLMQLLTTAGSGAEGFKIFKILGSK